MNKPAHNVVSRIIRMLRNSAGDSRCERHGGTRGLLAWQSSRSLQRRAADNVRISLIMRPCVSSHCVAAAARISVCALWITVQLCVRHGPPTASYRGWRPICVVVFILDNSFFLGRLIAFVHSFAGHVPVTGGRGEGDEKDQSCMCGWL